MNQLSARKQTSYEIYFMDRSGRWQLCAHYGGSDKAEAEDEAYALERQVNIAAVKIVREIYDPETNSSSEYITYETRNPKKLAPIIPVAATRPASQKPKIAAKTAPSHASYDFRPPQAPSEGGSLPSFVAKLVLAFLIAVAVGLGLMLLSSSLLSVLPKYGVIVSQLFYDRTNFITFVIGFLGSALPMFIKTTQSFNGKGFGAGKDISGSGSNRHSDIKSFNEPWQASGSNGTQDTPDSLAESLHHNRKIIQVDADQATDDPAQREIATKDVLTKRGEILDEQRQEPSADSQDSERKEKPLRETKLTSLARQKMVTFLSQAVALIKETQISIDAYHKFGINLYIAGACASCTTNYKLSPKQNRKTLTECIAALGANEHMANTFCDNLEGYLPEAKYRQMYESGRQAMIDFLADEKSLIGNIANALAEWSEKPFLAQQKGANRQFTVMFTDIIDSTRKTQELGDIGAQQMLHVHNRIVRSALLNHYGREIKHLGDGIMASFPSTTGAVDAALEIQKELAIHNESGELPFEVRIGINAGEAIAEGNDLFGSVVQLAARVCAKASGKQIFASETVKNTYTGHRAILTSIGTHELKGFEMPQEIFDVQPRYDDYASQESPAASDQEAD